MNKFNFEAVWKASGIIFAAGVLYAQLFGIRNDLERLTQKVEKHNNFDRRIVKLETIITMYKLGGANNELDKD